MSKPRFEDQLKRLSAIVDDLERGELPLEEGVALFKEGLAISKACSEQLRAAKTEIELAGGGSLDLDGDPGQGDDDGEGQA